MRPQRHRCPTFAPSDDSFRGSGSRFASTHPRDRASPRRGRDTLDSWRSRVHRVREFDRRVPNFKFARPRLGCRERFVIIAALRMSRRLLSGRRMFENLSDRLSKALRNVAGRGRLSEENITESLREVRTALLEADVALEVVRDFVERVRQRALGQDVIGSLSPGQMLVKVVHDELVGLMGVVNDSLALAVASPAVVLMAGLQGSGKTTTVAKLAKLLKERDRKKVVVVSTDVYRPAAIEQLATLATEVGVEALPANAMEKPAGIATRSIELARARFADVLVVDTAGRLHVG